MKDTELRKQRDSALYETFVRGLKSCHFDNMHMAADWVRKQSAPSFFISPKSLVNYFGQLMRGESLDRLHPNTRSKVMELYRRYQEFLIENGDCGLCRERICEMLVEEEAPRFYLGHDSVLIILQKERSRRRREFAKRYKGHR